MAIRDGRGYTTTTIDIGDWNMDTTTSVNVAHGLSVAEYKSIRNISVIIRNDGDSSYNHLNRGVDATDTTPQGFIQGYGITNIVLVRLTTGLFDATTYDSTSYNRGWITIEYIAD